MPDQNVPPTKPASELQVGDWIHAGSLHSSLTGRIAEVVFARPYTEFGRREITVLAVLAETDKPLRYDREPNHHFRMVTAEEQAEAKGRAERAKGIADIRAFADWLEANPGLPLSRLDMQVSPGSLEALPHLDVWDSGAEGRAELRRWADIMGEPVRDGADRTDVTKRFGGVEYRAIAWHKDGRSDGPICTPERRLDHGHTVACGPMADPTGLAYTRADTEDDPTPVSPARVPLHTGAVVDGGELVDETEPVR